MKRGGVLGFGLVLSLSAWAAKDPGYDALRQRLADLQTLERAEGQTLLTGQQLTFDLDKRFVRLKTGVRVDADRGTLTAEALVGRFSEARELTSMEAETQVHFVGEGYDVYGERLIYHHASGELDLVGAAVATHVATGNRIHGGHIKVWTEAGARRVECEPNARLLLLDTNGFHLEGVDALGEGAGLDGVTDIRAQQFVYDETSGLISLNGAVWIMNPQASLECGRAQIQLSATNELVSVAAQDSVSIRSGGRTATAEKVVYEHGDARVQLDGHASVSEGENALFGERIQLWLSGERKMICEPNARLTIRDASGFSMEGSSNTNAVDVEIRANRLIFDETARLAVCEGQVRLRELRGGMNCDNLRLYLKEGNEIDWIEATSEVIIQSGERKALADKASYFKEEGKVVLEGSPKLKQGANIMTGDRITFWQDSPRMVCEPNARIVLYPAAIMKMMDELKD